MSVTVKLCYEHLLCQAALAGQSCDGALRSRWAHHVWVSTDVSATVKPCGEHMLCQAALAGLHLVSSKKAILHDRIFFKCSCTVGRVRVSQLLDHSHVISPVLFCTVSIGFFIDFNIFHAVSDCISSLCRVCVSK